MNFFKTTLTAAVVVGLGLTACSTDKSNDMDSFVSDLMGKMTLEEKIGQTNLPVGGDFTTGAPMDSPIGELAAAGRMGGTFNLTGEKIYALQRVAVEESRLHIPLLIGMDVIHGYRTVFPIPFGLSASWDTTAVERMARISAVEASAVGINWTFSPMVDITRDPRWGRVAEGNGEDPYLGSKLGAAYIRGYQGDLTRPDEILACVKHFALYGAAEAGRDYNTVDMSRQRMYNEYLAPYKATVDAGVATVMTSFNLVDGIPATANKWLVDDLLRKQWGFTGMVVTDYASINEMTSHGLGEQKENAIRALKAGTDMDMCSDAFIGQLKEAVEKGEVSEELVDRACRKVLEAKYRAGLFDDPYKFSDTTRIAKYTLTPEHRAAAREIAAETFVLLKNEGNVLPLAAKGKIAIVGPLGNNRDNMMGTWSANGVGNECVSVFEGFKNYVGDKAEVVYAKGSNIDAGDRIEQGSQAYGGAMRDPRSEAEMLAEALQTVRGADVIVAAVGETNGMSGEGSSLTNITLPETQRKLLKALLATGKPVVMLNFSGRPTVMDWESENIPAILNVWFPGTEAGNAIADVVFGKVNPSGKLTMSMPRTVGQIPVYYNHMNTGRPNDSGDFHAFSSCYMDVPNSPLYPFGYGLSYTTFSYSDFTLDNDKLTKDGKIAASVKVTNNGSVAGTEIVQFYTRDMAASLARPVKELKYFERISLAPGESKVVTFDITADRLAFYNADGETVVEPGAFKVMAGPNSRDVETLDFTLE